MSNPAPRHGQHRPRGSCSTLCPNAREADPPSSRSPRVHSPPEPSSCLPTHTPQYLTHFLFNSPSALLPTHLLNFTPQTSIHPTPACLHLNPPTTMALTSVPQGGQPVSSKAPSETSNCSKANHHHRPVDGMSKADPAIPSHRGEACPQPSIS